MKVRIAVPVVAGKLSQHFGHCDCFALVEVDTTQRQIISQEELQAPPHEPGVLPRWLAEQGAEVILAGGMGQRAQGLFAAQGIRVLVGVPSESPAVLVQRYLEGTLATGVNSCDH